jgi:hypothetical protein
VGLSERTTLIDFFMRPLRASGLQISTVSALGVVPRT